MSVRIGNVIANVQIPVRQATRTGSAAVSDLTKAMDALEIGEGFDYVVEGSVSEANPTGKAQLKNQYAKISSATWAPKGKTFKVFEAEDQTGLAERETRFVIARVDFVQPKVRQKKATEAQAPADAAEATV